MIRMKRIGEIEQELSLAKPYREQLVKTEEAIKDIEEKIKVAFVAGDKAIEVLICKDTYNNFVKILTDAGYHMRYLKELHSPELNTYFIYVEINWKH